MSERRAPPEFGFDAPGEQWFAQLRDAVQPAPVQRIGPYDVTGEVGRGGQGIVYRAVHRETGRVVALKRMIAGTLSSPEARSRFRREVELVASLQHPAIVRVTGVESLDDHAVVVMEWVDGVPITQWALRDQGRRSVGDVVAVLARICDGVHHAHQRGVLHRDLKPSNVLVDASDRPVVVDFGVAKPIGKPDASRLTASDQFVGTLAYAAPEQVHDGAHEADVRADVWALGAILYETLTGRRPHGDAASMADAVLALQRGSPPRPSRYAPGVGYELDTIVLEALAVEPEMRYQSVDALGQDLRRLQRGEPIQAHPPSTWYQIRKLVRRNRLAVSLGTLAATLALSGVGLWAYQSGRVVHAQDRANEARVLADEVSAVMLDMFRDLSPMKDGERTTLPGVVQNVTERIDQSFGPGSPMRAPLFETLATVLFDWGRPDVAVGMLRSAVADRLPAHETHPRALARARVLLGVALHRSEQGEEARVVLDEALADLRAAGLGETKQAGLLVRECADLRYRFGELDEAKSLAIEALAVLKKTAGEDSGPYAEALTTHGDVLGALGQTAERVQALKRAAEIMRAAEGDAHPATAAALHRLAGAATAHHDLELAESACTEALKICRGTLPAGHPRTGKILVTLAEVEYSRQRLSEAADRFGEAVTILKPHASTEPRSLATAQRGGGRVAYLRNEFDTAEKLFREALATLRQHAPGATAKIADALTFISQVLEMRVIRGAGSAEDLAEAEQLARESVDLQREKLGRLTSIGALIGLARITGSRGDHESHLRLLGEALEAERQIRPNGSSDTVYVLMEMARVELNAAVSRARSARSAEVGACLARIAEALEEAQRIGMAPTSLYVVSARELEVLAYRRSGRRTEAIAVAKKVVAVAGGIPVVADQCAQLRVALASMLEREGDAPAAEEQLRTLHGELVQLLEANDKPEWRRLRAEVRRRLAAVNERMGRSAEAERWRRDG